VKSNRSLHEESLVLNANCMPLWSCYSDELSKKRHESSISWCSNCLLPMTNLNFLFPMLKCRKPFVTELASAPRPGTTQRVTPSAAVPDLGNFLSDVRCCDCIGRAERRSITKTDAPDDHFRDLNPPGGARRNILCCRCPRTARRALLTFAAAGFRSLRTELGN
jgi:hypothetical protein